MADNFCVAHPEIESVFDRSSGRLMTAQEAIGNNYAEVEALRMRLAESVAMDKPAYICPVCHVGVYLACRRGGRWFEKAVNNSAAAVRVTNSTGGFRRLPAHSSRHVSLHYKVCDKGLNGFIALVVRRHASFHHPLFWSGFRRSHLNNLCFYRKLVTRTHGLMPLKHIQPGTNDATCWLEFTFDEQVHRHRRRMLAVKLTPASEVGVGTAVADEKKRLLEIAGRMNDLFSGDLSEGDMVGYITTLSGKLLENETLAQQAEANTEEQFGMGDFKNAMTDVVLDSQEAHSSIANQLLTDERVFAAMQGMLAKMVYRAFAARH